jgi:transcription elongation factor Elf1
MTNAGRYIYRFRCPRCDSEVNVSVDADAGRPRMKCAACSARDLTICEMAVLRVKYDPMRDAS